MQVEVVKPGNAGVFPSVPWKTVRIALLVVAARCQALVAGNSGHLSDSRLSGGSGRRRIRRYARRKWKSNFLEGGKLVESKHFGNQWTMDAAWRPPPLNLGQARPLQGKLGTIDYLTDTVTTHQILSFSVSGGIITTLKGMFGIWQLSPTGTSGSHFCPYCNRAKKNLPARWPTDGPLVGFGSLVGRPMQVH